MSKIDLDRLLSDLRAVRAHHAFTQDRVGQPGCKVRQAAAEYVATLDAAIQALTDTSPPSSPQAG